MQRQRVEQYWTSEELSMLSSSQQLAIRVYCLRMDDFCEDIGNVLRFHSAIKQVRDARGNLPIPQSFLYDTNILIGFTSAHFLRSSFIHVDDDAFATLLMSLLKKRLYPPWEMKWSIKHFPIWFAKDDNYTSHPYHILQVQNITREKDGKDGR
jgi:hypothetical protein